MTEPKRVRTTGKEIGKRVFVPRHDLHGTITGFDADLLRIRLSDGSTCWCDREEVHHLEG